MPKHKYDVTVNGSQTSLIIERNAFFTKAKIYLGGVLLGEVHNSDEFQAGKEFVASDESTLKVRLVKEFMNPVLEVLWNKNPVSGSGTDPKARIKAAAGVVVFVGIVNILIGSYAVTRENLTLLMIGIGIYNIIEGAIYCVLAFFIHQESLVATVIALSLYCFDWVGTFFMAIRASQIDHAYGAGFSGGFVMRIFIITILVQAIKALRGTKKIPSV